MRPNENSESRAKRGQKESYWGVNTGQAITRRSGQPPSGTQAKLGGLTSDLLFVDLEESLVPQVRFHYVKLMRCLVFNKQNKRQSMLLQGHSKAL